MLKSSGICDSIDYRQESLCLNVKVKRSLEMPVNLYQSTLRPLISFWMDILPKSSGRSGANFRKFSTRCLDSETALFMKSHNINFLQKTPVP
jgi:hypothetical protein